MSLNSNSQANKLSILGKLDHFIKLKNLFSTMQLSNFQSRVSKFITNFWWDRLMLSKLDHFRIQKKFLKDIAL